MWNQGLRYYYTWTVARSVALSNFDSESNQTPTPDSGSIPTYGMVDGLDSPSYVLPYPGDCMKWSRVEPSRRMENGDEKGKGFWREGGAKMLKWGGFLLNSRTSVRPPSSGGSVLLNWPAPLCPTIIFLGRWGGRSEVTVKVMEWGCCRKIPSTRIRRSGHAIFYSCWSFDKLSLVWTTDLKYGFGMYVKPTALPASFSPPGNGSTQPPLKDRMAWRPDIHKYPEVVSIR